MKFKPTWILFGVALAALAYFFLIERPRHDRQISDARDQSKLVSIDGDAVTLIAIDRDETSLEFERRDNTWFLRAPVIDMANQSNVNVILKTLDDAVIERRFDANPDRLNDYDLSPPYARVILKTRARSDTVLVGGFNPDKSACYASRGGGVVFLVHAGVRRTLRHSLTEFRDKRIAAYQMDQITRFEMEVPDQLFSWERYHDGWFTIRNGDTIRGDKTAVETIPRALRGLRADEILDPDRQFTEKYFEPADGRISVWLADSVITFALAKAEPQGHLYVGSSVNPRVARTETGLLESIAQPFAHFRDRRLLHFTPADVFRVALESTNKTVSIKRRAQKWSFGNPNLGTIDPEAVASLFTELTDLKFREILAERVVAPHEYGLANPKFRLTLYNGNGDVIDRMDAGESRTIQRIRYSTNLSNRQLAVVDSEPLEAIERYFDRFRDGE